jgi:hypothetical protein
MFGIPGGLLDFLERNAILQVHKLCCVAMESNHGVS